MGKLKIAICDDIPIVTSTIENFLMNFNHCKFECDCFNNSERLLTNLSYQRYDIYILDVEMPDFNGLEVASEIRKKDYNAYIIFLTSHANYMKEVFQVNTFDYLLKPINKNRLYETMDRILSFIENDDSKFLYLKRNSQTIIPLKDIIYFEKQGRYVIMYSLNFSDKFIMSTQDLIENLDKRFLQIHTSFIINLKYLQRIEGNKVVLATKNDKNRKTILLNISRKFNVNVRDQVMKYMEGKLGI